MSCARKSGQFILKFFYLPIFVPSSFRVLNALLFSSLSLKNWKNSLSMSRFIFALLTFIKTTTTSTTLTTRGHGGARTTFSLSFFLSFFRFNVVGVINACVKISKERERERDVSSTVFLSLSLSLSLSLKLLGRGALCDEYSGASSIFRARRLTLFFLSFSLHSKGVVVGVF